MSLRWNTLTILLAMLVTQGETMAQSTPGKDTAEHPLYKEAKAPVERRVEDLLLRMTLEEKIAQLCGVWPPDRLAGPNQVFDPARAKPLLGNGVCTIGPFRLPLDQEIPFRNAIQKYLIENTRLGIPVVFHDEGCHGVSAPNATSFPAPIGIACSWDPDLVERIYTVVAAEMRARGSQYTLAPIVDICRDPRWGRTDETMGEDPYLNGKLGAAMVFGFQGHDGPSAIGAGHVAATLKHLTGHGQPEGGNNRSPGDVTLRQLRYFAVLGEELNYRRAAERLFITQPALSTAIKQLEHQLGVMLFTRSTREVALTELGQAWLPKVRDALHSIDAAVDDLIALSAHYRRIRLGYLIGTGADLLFRLLRHFEAAYPEITLEPREFDFSDPTAGLADGSTEVAIIRPPVDLPEHRMFILDAEDWVACLPRDHPLASRSELRIAELLDDPIVVAPASAGRWRDYWMAMDARGGKPPTIAAVAATYEEETTTIARGLGISFTSEASARLYNRQGIAYVPIVDRPRNYTALAWHPAGLSREAAQLVRHVREEWSFGEGQAVERPATYY